MTAGIGVAALWGAFAAALLGALRPRWRPWVAVLGTALGLCVATAALTWALATNDYTLEYVAQAARRGAPAGYRVAGLWGAMAGSLLLWTTFVALWGTSALRSTRDQSAAGRAGVTRASSGVTLVFLVPLLTASRPFTVLDRPPLDGTGLNAVLEHPAMLYHPPLLYLGLTALFPLAVLAVAGIDVRRRLLISVALLGAGMLAGAHWAYQELGWGGFWAWDPIENAALVPWLVAIAALHERGGRRARVLTVVAALCAGAGAFLTRSGATVSVHAFGEARAVGWLVLAGLGAATAVAAVALARQRPLDAPERRVPVAVWALVVPAAVIAFATFIPALLGALLDRPRTIDPRFFTIFAAPLLLVGAAVAARQVVRRSISMGAAVAHAGVALVAIGAVASSFGWSATVPLRTGETAVARGMTLELVRVDALTRDRRAELVATVRVGERTLRPALRAGTPSPTSETAIASTLVGDLLVTPRRIDASGLAVIDVHRKPLVPWVWAGSLAIVAGTLLSLRTRRRGVSAKAGGLARRAPPVPEASAQPRPAEAPPAVLTER